MKFHSILRAIAASAVILCATSAYAKLQPGDPAPKLQVGKWVQGDPVKEFESGTTYIVEFWATWCGPCRETIPHVNAVYQKFKDKGLVVIGQDVWEENEEGVAPFVKMMGTKMTYRVALDDKTKDEKGVMARTWMEAAGQNGIPTAFVVDKKGIIAWIGHPAEMTEKMLTDIFAGKFDAKKFADEKEKLEALGQKYMAAIQKEEWAKAEAALDDLEKVLPKEEQGETRLARFKLYAAKGDFAGAYKLAGAISEAYPADGQFQNALAWMILTDEGLKNRDVALAEKIATRASKATEGKDPNILDTLARAQFMNGKKKEAVETEQKAVDLAEGKSKADFKASLESYRKGELPKITD